MSTAEWIVTPRAYLPHGGGIAPLESIIRMELANQPRPVIVILGGPGSGKTAAIKHLEKKFPGGSIEWLDDPKSNYCAAERFAGPVVCTATKPLKLTRDVRHLLLAGWSQDQWIEYLLLAHPKQIKSVMQRILADPHRNIVEAVPALWRLILDVLATDERIETVTQALRQVICDRIPVEKQSRTLVDRCHYVLVNGEPFFTNDCGMPNNLAEFMFGQDNHILRHPSVQMLIVHDALIRQLMRRRARGLLNRKMPACLVNLAGQSVAQIGAVRNALQEALANPRIKQHAVILGMFHAAGVCCEIPAGLELNLAGAELTGIDLHNCLMCRLRARGAQLASADFSNSDLQSADFAEANLRGAKFVQANLKHAYFQNAELSACDFRKADLSKSYFSGSASDANFESTCCRYAVLEDCRWEGARLVRADFGGARLNSVRLQNADCSAADFSFTQVTDMKLNQMILHGAIFRSALLCRCDCSYMHFPAPEFSIAHFIRVDFTGSRCPNANFKNARFDRCGFAEVDWEGASLNGAELCKCSFQTGSSRSGLVGSPLACEGSRTGFYTDESDEQTFKSPEEIRKANLCGVDLRGAKIDGVDFYLVDLRHAKYDPSQAEWLRRCRAIL